MPDTKNIHTVLCRTEYIISWDPQQQNLVCCYTTWQSQRYNWWTSSHLWETLDDCAFLCLSVSM